MADPGWTPLDLRLDMDSEPWTDLPADQILPGTLERVGLQRHGTTKGRASVALLIRLPDGRPVIAQTTWRLFHVAHMAMAASPAIAEETDD